LLSSCDDGRSTIDNGAIIDRPSSIRSPIG